MKTSLIILAALTAALTPAFSQWSVEYMSAPRYVTASAQFPNHVVFVTDSWER
jgi:hypothetical protein